MAATMTDVQEAIDQLGKKRDVDQDTASRSFSFASSKDDADTDHDNEPDSDDHEANGGEAWRKDARKMLAAKAKREMQKREAAEAAASSSYAAPRASVPPIDVEISDESEDEDGHHHHHHHEDHTAPASFAQFAIAKGGPASTSESPRTATYPKPQQQPQTQPQTQTSPLDPVLPHQHQLHHADTDTDHADTEGFSPLSSDMPSPSPLEAAAPILKSMPTGSGLPTPSTDAALSQRGSGVSQTQVLSAPPVAQSGPQSAKSPPTPHTPAAHPSPSPGILARANSQTQPSTQSTTPVPSQAPTFPVPQPYNGPGALPSPAASSMGHQQMPTTATGSTFSKAPVSTAATTPPVRKNTHPAEWTVDQVITWLRSKGFDDAVCAKFTGIEIHQNPPGKNC